MNKETGRIDKKNLGSIVISEKEKTRINDIVMMLNDAFLKDNKGGTKLMRKDSLADFCRMVSRVVENETGTIIRCWFNIQSNLLPASVDLRWTVEKLGKEYDIEEDFYSVQKSQGYTYDTNKGEFVDFNDGKKLIL